MFNGNTDLIKRIDELEKTIVMQNKLFSGFLSKLDAIFENLNRKTDENNEWLKEYHRLALNEYMSGPRKKVYAFIYNKNSSNESRIVMAARDRFEDAEKSAKQSFSSVDEDVENWTMAAYKSLDLPEGSIDVVDKIDKMMKFEKPIDAYLHEISLARDKFCTPNQKKVFNSVIEKIKRSYKQ